MDPAAPGGPGTPAPPGSVAGPAPVAPSGAVVGPTMMRLLTNIEYRNTLAALTGAPAPLDQLAPDSLTDGFDNVASALTVNPTKTGQYANLALKAARTLTFEPCAGDALACATTFIADFGKRAFRRPLMAAELSDYTVLYEDEAGRLGHEAGLLQVAQTLLQSPHLLYRLEYGSADTGTNRTLTPYETASALSYFLTASPPDDALLSAAEAQGLRSAQELEAQARRLLGSPQAKETLRRFVQSFAGLLPFPNTLKDTELFPAFTPELRSSMEQETARFIDDVLWESDGSYQALLSAPYTYVDARLAGFYGLAEPSADGFSRVSANPAQRQGLLTHASVLAVHSKAGESDPVKRGKFVRVGLLCQSLPSPPAEVPRVEPPSPELTTRERFQQHSVDPACAGCHQLIDPVGFGLENYDAIGQYRQVENGKPVDATGSLTATLDIDGPFSGGVELASKLAASREAQQCMALKAYSWAFGRGIEGHERAATDAIVAALTAGGLDLRELMVAITRSDNFLFRTYR
jgi:hypothetical protein